MIADRRRRYSVAIPDVPGVYCITDRATGYRYVGQSRCCGMRRASHFAALRRGQHTNPLLQQAFDLHGEGSFDYQIIERTSADERSRVVAELKHAERLRPEFNQRDSRMQKLAEALGGKIEFVAAKRKRGAK